MKRWYFNLTRISQLDNNGCGIASVAIVCGVTYDRARAEFFPRRRRFKDDKSLHVDSEQMMRVIRRLGFSVVVRDSYLGTMRPSIVPIAWSPGSPNTAVHAVVWDPWAKRVLDPGWDHPSTERLKEMWKRSGYQVLTVTGRR
jgi:hypothetical protein